MLDYPVRLGLAAMRRNVTGRSRKTFLTCYSAKQRGNDPITDI